MTNKSGYKGKIYFYKCLRSNTVGAITEQDYANGFPFSGDDGFFLLGETDVDVKFTDSTAAEVESLELAIEEEKRQSSEKIAALKDAIQDRLSLPSPDVMV